GPRRRCRATAQAAIEILVIIDLALLETLHFVAQLFDHATQIADLFLHDLQLVVDIARRAALLGLGPQWQTEHQCQGNTHHVAHRIILAERPVSTKTKSQAQNTAPGFGEQTARLLHFDATVEGPGLVVAAELGRALLAVADHFEVGGIHALQGEVLLDRVGATLAEGHVVLAGTALVGMAFEADLTVAAAQTLGVDVEGGAGLAGQHRLVELEVEDGGNAAGAEVIAVGGTVAS